MPLHHDGDGGAIGERQLPQLRVALEEAPGRSFTALVDPFELERSLRDQAPHVMPEGDSSPGARLVRTPVNASSST